MFSSVYYVKEGSLKCCLLLQKKETATFERVCWWFCLSCLLFFIYIYWFYVHCTFWMYVHSFFLCMHKYLCVCMHIFVPVCICLLLCVCVLLFSLHKLQHILFKCGYILVLTSKCFWKDSKLSVKNLDINCYAH